MAKKTQFYFRVIDQNKLTQVKEGEVFQYQLPSVRESEVADFFLRDGRPGTGTDDKGFITDPIIKRDLEVVILNSMFEKSAKDDFSEPYIPKRERERLAKEYERAIKEKEEQQAKREAEAARASQPTTPQPAQTNKPTTASKPTGAKKVAKASPTMREDAPTSKPKPLTASQREAKEATSRKKVILETDYSKFTEKELDNLFTLAYKWIYGSDKDLKKALRQDIGEKIEAIDEFIDYGLAKKKVTDDEIPPLNYLERIPQIANNRELLLFYRRKLHRGAGAQFGRKIAFSGDRTFDMASMPSSIRVGAMLGKFAIKGAIGGAGLAISGIRTLSDKIKDAREKREAANAAQVEAKENDKRDVAAPAPIEAKESNKSEVIATKAHEIQQPEQKEPIKAEVPVKSVSVVTPAYAKSGMVLGRHAQSGGDGEMMKTLIDTLIQIKKYIKSKLVEETGVREAKNTTFADITDKNITAAPTTKEPVAAGGVGETSEKKGGGLIETIAGLLNPMKLFGNALKLGLKGMRMFSTFIESMTPVFRGAMKAISGFTRAIGAVLRSMGGMVANLAKSAGGTLLRGAASIIGGIGEGVLAVGGATIAAGAAAVTGVAAAGQAIHSVATGGDGSNFISDALGVKNWFDAPKPEQTPEQKAQIAALEKRHSENMQAVQKNNAQRLVEAGQQQEALKEVKEDRKTQQMVDASTKATTTIVQNSGGFSRPSPRTQDSTLQSILKLKSFYGVMPA